MIKIDDEQKRPAVNYSECISLCMRVSLISRQQFVGSIDVVLCLERA